jgi:aldose 1-epimerase
MFPSGEQWEIEHGRLRAVVVEVGGGLRCLTAAGTDVLLGYAIDEMCSAGRGQVLAPWPNRLEDGAYVFEGEELQLPVNEQETRCAIHGLVRWEPWVLSEHGSGHVCVEHLLAPQPGYPFALRLRVRYRLDDAGLAVESSAENVGERPAPFGLAHHPYLAGRADDFTVSFAARTRLTSDERKLPVGREPNDLPEEFAVGERRLDATFTDLERHDVRIGAHRVWFDESFPYVQLFTGDHPKVRRAGFAVEPMTCPPNAFQSGEGLIVLQPGQTFRGRWGIEVGGTLPALPS